MLSNKASVFKLEFCSLCVDVDLSFVDVKAGGLFVSDDVAGETSGRSENKIMRSFEDCFGLPDFSLKGNVSSFSSWGGGVKMWFILLVWGENALSMSSSHNEHLHSKRCPLELYLLCVFPFSSNCWYQGLFHDICQEGIS